MIRLALQPVQANWLLAVLRDLSSQGVQEATLQVTTYQALGRAVDEAEAKAKLPPELEVAPPAPPAGTGPSKLVQPLADEGEPSPEEAPGE